MTVAWVHVVRGVIAVALRALAACAVVLLSSWLGDRTSAQSPTPSALRAAGEPPEPNLLPLPTPERPPPYVLPPIDRSPVPEGLGFDPLIERPFAPRSGWYTDVETSILSVHLRNQLRETVSVGDRSDPFDENLVPGSRLNTAVVPELGLGYRMANGLGAFVLSYRFLRTSGSAVTGAGLGPALQHGHLDLNVVELDYRSREYSLGEFPGDRWNFRWSFGLRFAQSDFSNRLSFASPNPLLPADAVLEQSTFNNFAGLGPHAVVLVERKLDRVLPGLAFGGSLDSGDTFGGIVQHFSETINGTPGTGPQVGVTNNKNQVGVLSLRAQVGFSYTVPRWNHSYLFVGYQYESWFQLGRLNSSRGQLNLSGLVLRLEYNF
jgi:hypothetical protein